MAPPFAVPAIQSRHVLVAGAGAGIDVVFAAAAAVVVVVVGVGVGVGVVVVAAVVEYHSNCINIIVELDDLTGARFILFFTVLSQRTCLKPWF